MARASSAIHTRERSTWGWDWAERFPAPTARRQIGKMAEVRLGVSGLELREPVADAETRVPESRLASVPRGIALDTSRAARMTHAHGRSYPDQLRGFTGDLARAPDAVAYPASEADVAAVLA